MSFAARTVQSFGIYLVVVGAIATTIPNVLFSALGIPATDEPWIRMLGVVVLVLAYYYLTAARHDLTAFHRATVPGRVVAGVGLILLMAVWGHWPAIIFGLTDLAGAAWTAVALRADAKAPRPAGARPSAGLSVLVLLGLAGSAVVAAPAPAAAQECPDGAVSWVVSGSQDWFTSANWSDGTVPGATTDVCISSGSTIDVDGAVAEAASVTVTHADAVLRVRASSGKDGTLSIVGDVQNLGRIELGSVSSGTVAGHLEVGGSIRNGGTLGATTSSQGPLPAVTAEEIRNFGAITVARDLILDAATITSAGGITVSGFGTVTVRYTGAATGPDVTVSGSIDHSEFSAWVQSGGSLDLTGSSLDSGDYTLTAVDVVIGHSAVGSAVPVIRAIDGDVHLDPTAPAVDVEIVGAATTLTGGGIGTDQAVAIENVGGGTVTTVTVPGDLVNDGAIALHRSGTGGGESHLVVTGRFTNAGTLTTTTGSDREYSVTAEQIDNDGDVIVNRDLTLDAATLTSPGEIAFSSFNVLTVSDTGAATGPDVTLSGSIEMNLNQRYDQIGGTLAIADGVVVGGGTLRLTDVDVRAVGAIAGRVELLGSSVLSPGASLGRLDISGAYQQGPDATLDVELGGTTPGDGHDQVNAAGPAILAGTLQLGLVDGFEPAPCDVFDVLTTSARSGAFASVTGTDAGGGLQLFPLYRSTGLRLVTGTAADALQVFPTAHEVQRAAPSTTYALCLAGPPGVEVTVVPTADDGAVTLDPPQLTFTPGNWQDPQIVTATGAYGAAPAVDRHVTISHAASGSGQFSLDTDAIVTILLRGDGPVTDPDPGPTPDPQPDPNPVPDPDIGPHPDPTPGASEDPGPVEVTTDDPVEPGVVRHGGLDRFETAAQLSAATFAAAVDVVYVATGGRFADALTGGVPAALAGAPLLLVADDAIPAVTRTEIDRLAPDRIVVLGGTAAVSAAVEADLAALAGGQTSRVAGVDRYDTARLIAAATFPTGADVVFVAGGSDFPDALSGVPAAAIAPGPLLLVTDDALPAATAEALDGLSPGRIIVLGGTAAVSEEIADQLAAWGDVDRIAGQDRYGTSAAVAANAFPDGADIIYVTTGENFPDALTSGVVAGAQGAPVLLVTRTAIPPEILERVTELAPSRIVILGGQAAVGPEVEGVLRELLSEPS